MISHLVRCALIQFFILIHCIQISPVNCQCILDEYEGLALETDLGPDYCADNQYYKEVVDGCAPGCVKKIDKGKGPCDVANNANDDDKCPPGLKCDGRFCSIVDYSSCYKYDYDGQKVFNYPSCTPDGKWQPKQCKGGKIMGRCFCYDENGKRLEGAEWAKDAEDMTCACSRKKEELKSKDWFVSLHCDNKGNYEPLQCDVISKFCWCVEPTTGDLISKVVPEKMLKMLHCYNETVNGDHQYLRQCESLEYAQAQSKYILKLHGTEHVDYPHLMCDLDGSYGRKQLINGHVYCKWKDNENIDNYQSDSTQGVETVNCYCARDVRYYQQEGIALQPACMNTGNYNLKQQDTQGNYYCIDPDGFKTSDSFQDDPQLPVDCTKYLI